MVRQFWRAGLVASALCGASAALAADELTTQGPAERAGERVDETARDIRNDANDNAQELRAVGEQSAREADEAATEGAEKSRVFAEDTADKFNENKRELKNSTGMDTLRVQLNAGVAGFTGGLGGLTTTGPTYGVTAGGSWSDIFGFEAGYEGSRTPVDRFTTGIPGGGLWRHDLFGLAKAGYPIRVPSGSVRPYVGAGLGVSYLNANDEADGPYQNDVFGEIPFALGAEYNRGMLTAGLRATYRVLFADEFAEDVVGGDQPNGGMLGAALTVGARF